MEELLGIDHHGTVPWSPSNAKNQKIQRLRMLDKPPAVGQSRRYRCSHCQAVIGGLVGICIIRQRYMSHIIEDGPHKSPAVEAIAAAPLIQIRQPDVVTSPGWNQRNRPAELVGM